MKLDMPIAFFAKTCAALFTSQFLKVASNDFEYVNIIPEPFQCSYFCCKVFATYKESHSKICAKAPSFDK